MTTLPRLASNFPNFDDTALAPAAGKLLIANASAVWAADDQPYLLPIGTYRDVSPMTSAATRYPFGATVPKAATIQQWLQAIYVAATNDATHYWTINLARQDTGAALSSFTTAALTAATWYRVDSGALSIAITTAMIAITLAAVPTNGPGDLYLQAPAVWVK